MENRRITENLSIYKEIKDIMNTPMKLEEIIYRLRKSGILLYPSESDVEYVNVKVKVSYLLFLSYLELKNSRACH